VAKPKPGAPAPALTVRVEVHVVSGAAGRAVAAAQGRAVRSLLAALRAAETAEKAKAVTRPHDTDVQTGHIYRNR
jgi:hypothetical protein